MHASEIEQFDRDGESWVRFVVLPWQRSDRDPIIVEAVLHDTREVRSSAGASQIRPVIRTIVRIMDRDQQIEVTLTDRADMRFRMLLGREAIKRNYIVNPGRVIQGRQAIQDDPRSQPGTVAVTRTRPDFVVAGSSVRPGTRRQCELPISKLVTGTEMSLPVMVVHGAHDGPCVWLNAAIHGDEINGVEIIRRVLEHLDPRRLSGTVLAVPIVNVHGFVTGDRYLPDRRDLNRSFPGSARGSLASRIANLLMTEVVARCSMGIDIHTGSDQRSNLPQIRADLDHAGTRALAHGVRSADHHPRRNEGRIVTPGRNRRRRDRAPLRRG